MQSHPDALRTGLLRIYCIATAVLVAAVETEWEVLLAQMKVLESWVGRGLLQVRVWHGCGFTWGFAAFGIKAWRDL